MNSFDPILGLPPCKTSTGHLYPALPALSCLAAFLTLTGVSLAYARQSANFTAAFETGLPRAMELAQAPLPPRRPAHLDNRETPPAQPPESRQAPAQETPRSILKPAPSGPNQKPGISNIPYHPMTEAGPMTARRAAVRACAEEWQHLKKTGAAGLRIWRDFSMECLTRKQ